MAIGEEEIQIHRQTALPERMEAAFTSSRPAFTSRSRREIIENDWVVHEVWCDGQKQMNYFTSAAITDDEAAPLVRRVLEEKRAIANFVHKDLQQLPTPTVYEFFGTAGFNAGRAFYTPSDKAVWYRSHEHSDRRHELFHWATLSNQSEGALPLIAVEGVAVWGNWKLMTDAQRRENLDNFHNYEKIAHQMAKSRLTHNLTLDSQDMTPIELMVYGGVLFQCLEEKLGPIKTAESFFQLQPGQSLIDWVSKLGLDPLELEKTWRDKIYAG